MDNLIEVERLSKHFGPVAAVNDVSFSVAKGEVLGFLGPNGAGKSTTMKMITGFLEPTSGDVKICGLDIRKHSIKAKEKIGYLPEGAPCYGEMTPASFLDFIAQVRGLSGQQRQACIADVVEKAHLETVMERPIETLSKGFKRRVGFAQAILHDPEILIMDEPTDGLDPNQKHEVRTLIKEMAKDKAIVISTHILEEVDTVCNRAIIIADGRLVFTGTPQELEAKSQLHNAVELNLSAANVDEARRQLKGLEGVETVQEETLPNDITQLLIKPKNGQPIIDKVSQLVVNGGWRVEQIATRAGRLDEVFREITTSGEQPRT